MKKSALLFTIILMIVSCKNEKKDVKKNITIPKIHNGLFIKGHINLPDNSVILLQEQSINKKFNTIQTTETKTNSFSFEEIINEEKLYFIGFNNHDKKIPFIANNHETVINIDINNIESTKVQGATIQQEYTRYTNNLDKAKNKFVYKTNYIKSNNNSILSAIILKQMLGKTKWRIEQNNKSYNNLSDKIKQSNIGKEIIAYITKNEPLVAKSKTVPEVSLNPEISNETPIKIIEKKATAVITPYRKKAPNFYAESINGNDISLKSITANNKVVLVDFWASWCAPCRAESPKIIQLYNKYHSKGFDVVGVSEDKYIDLNKWKNAVSLDGLPWHQVIDDNRRVAKMFGVSSIPHTVLLDQNGGIILNKKSSYTIEQKLKELFGF